MTWPKGEPRVQEHRVVVLGKKQSKVVVVEIGLLLGGVQLPVAPSLSSVSDDVCVHIDTTTTTGPSRMARRVSRTGPQSSAQKLLPGPNHGFMVENFTGSAMTTDPANCSTMKAAVLRVEFCDHNFLQKHFFFIRDS